MNWAPSAGGRKKCSPCLKAPAHIRLRTRFALTFSNAAVSAMVEYSSISLCVRRRRLTSNHSPTNLLSSRIEYSIARVQSQRLAHLFAYRKRLAVDDDFVFYHMVFVRSEAARSADIKFISQVSAIRFSTIKVLLPPGRRGLMVADGVAARTLVINP